MSLRFAHAMIQVRDLENAITFYERVLGLSVIERHDYDGASLAYLRSECGGPEIELLSEQPWTFARRPEKGRCHIAFMVRDVDAENARLKDLGVACEPVGHYEAGGKLQTRFFYFYDPEGNEIEILEAMGRYSAEGDPK
jgi:catechol 2,3-dioxygenase-like lactoylglutathione lyase family enzyme